MTCTPYGINTHRLLVTGTRIPNHDECPPETGCLTDGTLAITAFALTTVWAIIIALARHSYNEMHDRRSIVPTSRTHRLQPRKTLQGQIDIPLDIVGRWQADQSAYELARTYYWAKVAHLADHNDELAQPAYEARISPISTKSTRHRPQATHVRRVVRPFPRPTDRPRHRRPSRT